MPGGTSYARRVLVVEDEEFTRSMVCGGVQAAGFDVCGVPGVAEALEALADYEPHCIVTDLDFGSGPSGVDLVRRVNEMNPWVGIVVLTSHGSVELAVGKSAGLPEGVVYLVKSRIQSMADIEEAIEHALAKPELIDDEHTARESDSLVVTPTQGEILRLIAEGLSNAGIAKRRGTSLRAAEALVQRTIAALHIPHDPDTNPRVVAVRLWQQGRIVVR